MNRADLNHLISVLILSPQMQALWQIRDRGMPVLAHSVDVVLLCLDAFPARRDQYPSLDLAPVVIGGLLHDLSKLSARRWPGLSHTQMMTREPALAVAEAAHLLEWAQRRVGLRLAPDLVDHVRHVIMSHHGPWGKVKPATPEAQLVHECDLYSAMHHRVAPVDANDILPLLASGRRLTQVGFYLGVSREVVKSRLREACGAERVRDWPELLAIWRRRGRVVVGIPRRARQLERVRQIITVAREVPDSLTRRIAALEQAADSSMPAMGRLATACTA